MFSSGALIIAVASVSLLPIAAADAQSLLRLLAWLMTLGIGIEALGHIFHARDMRALSNEGAASYYRQVTQYGKSYRLLNVLLGISFVLAPGLASIGINNLAEIVAFVFLTPALLIVGVFGRSLFFVLVIPTTMPGAFFWKNEGFVEHARETGLADAPQHGVVYERHHAFKMTELMQTLKENSIKDMLAHVKWIFGG